MRWLIGSREIERILGKNFSNEMAYLLEQYINKSKQLQSIQAAMKSPSLDVDTMYQRIINLKNLKTNTDFHQSLIQPNLKKSLEMIRSYNVIIRDMEEAIIRFDTKNTDHNQERIYQQILLKTM